MDQFFNIYILILIALLKQCAGFDLYDELINQNFGNTSSLCVDNIKLIFEAARNASIEDNRWALQMMDSCAKVPIGLLYGNLVHIGQFDECIEVIHPEGNFIGQHCMADIAINTTQGNHFSKSSDKWTRNLVDVRSLSVKYGICLPSTCTIHDINQVLNLTRITDVLSMSVTPDTCLTNKPTYFSGGSLALISISFILIAVAMGSTLFELYQIHILHNDKTPNILCAFSLYSNTVKLFEIRDSSGEMSSLHGMRTLSMMWVVLCHSYSRSIGTPAINLIDSVKIIDDTSHIFVTNGWFAVDTFFFLSGLLVAFIFFRNIGKSGSYDAPLNYIHRYLRLTPTLIIVTCFNMTILMDMDKGPMWNAAVTPIVSSCQSSWWSILLYVQNYVHPDSKCVGQAWYLSADMQMFWIAPLILYPIYLWPKMGMTFLAFLTIGSTLLTFALAYVNEYKASVLLLTDISQFRYEYIPTHTRATPWFVGLALGVAICAIKTRKTKINLSKTIVLLGWAFSTSTCLGILYGLVRFQGDSNATAVESAIYLSLTRLGWAMGLSWVVFACIQGYGGWVNDFLSLGIFQPLGKLSYNVFLVQITIYAYVEGVYKTNYYFDDFRAMYNFLGTLVLAHLFAIILYLLLEAPIAVLDRKLLSSIRIFPYPSPKLRSKTDSEKDVEQAEKHEKKYTMKV